MLQKCRETALQWHLHLLKSGVEFNNHCCFKSGVGPPFSRNFGASSHFFPLVLGKNSVSLDRQEQIKSGSANSSKYKTFRKSEIDIFRHVSWFLSTLETCWQNCLRQVCFRCFFSNGHKCTGLTSSSALVSLLDLKGSNNWSQKHLAVGTYILEQQKKRVFVKEVPMNQEVYTPWTLSVVFFETWKIERSCKNSTIYINTSMLQRRWKPFPSSKTWKAPFFLYHKVGPRHRSVVNGGAMGL